MNGDNNTTLTPLKRFWRILKPDQKEINNVYLYSIASGLVNLSLPLGIQAIVNLIQGGQVSTAWIILVFFVVLGVAIAGVLQIFQLRITENIQQNIFTRAAFEFAYMLPRVKMEAFYKHYAPELVNRFFDILTIQKGIAKTLVDFTTAALHIVFGLTLLSFYHPFFIAFAIGLILLVVGIFRLTGKNGLETSLMESKFKYQLVFWLEEVARTLVSFKMSGKTVLPMQRTDGHVQDYLKAREGHFRVLVQQYSLMVFFKVFVITGLLAIGGVLVIEQQMNIGQFVAAEIIIILVMNSVEKMIASLDTIYDVLTALEKVGQVTDLELDKSTGIDMEQECRNEGMSVNLAEVNFAYPNHKQKTLLNLNLQVDSGEHVVIYGGNGSGKSTLLKLIAGLYEVSDGNLSYNGLSIGNVDLRSLRLVTGSCMAQEQLFQGTVLENIAMGRPDVTFENVRWATQKLGLDDFIRNLPLGFDTTLDPQGQKLARGIVQKILLARCIVNRPKLILLEDALQFITYQEKIKIVDFLVDKSNAWTIVAVSSDHYLIQKVNRIFIMKDGSVVQTGSYEELKNELNLLQ